MTLLKMIRVCLSQYSVVWLWALVVTLLGVSLASLFLSSSSNAQEVGPNGGTIVSEETTVQSIGGGLEVHTTTTVEEVTESVTTTTTTEGEPTTVVSPNLLENPGFQDSSNTTNVPDWNTTGGVFVGATCGPGLGKCLQTGNETTGGGAVSQTVDLFDEMTKDEVNRGFNLEYGAQVKPHVSNLTVPVCTAQHIASGPDCKDRFAISVHVTDSSGSLLHSFEHVFNDVDFVGTDQRGYEKNDFFFTSTVPSNNYDSALATFSLFGEDQGFFNGFAGPFFDNTRLKAIYTEVELITSTITEQVTRQIETITQETIQSSVPEITTDTATFDVTEVNETVEVTDNFETETVQAFEVTITDNMSNVETTFEVSVGANSEMTIEPITVESTTEVAETTSTTDKPESQENTQSSKDKSNEKPKTKEQLKKEIATRVVTKIIQNLGQDAASQATQLALMNVIGANLTIDAPVLQDRTDFFTTTTLPDSTISTNNYAQYIMFGGNNAAMNKLVDSQWK